jgi:hypothetical protein
MEDAPSGRFSPVPAEGGGDAARQRADGPPGRLRAVAAPFGRATGFYARAWRKYLREGGTGDLPVVRPSARLAGQAFLDEVVIAGFRLVKPLRVGAELVDIEREARAAVELYEQSGWLEKPETYHLTPPQLTKPRLRLASSRRHQYERLSFESGYEPHLDEPGRDRWLSYTPNRWARAWVLRHDEPRPWLVAVHGAVMGRPQLDLTLFRARWLHEDLGLNVLFPVLPLHGPRKEGLPKDAMYPGEDVMDNIHGAAQSVWDIRRLISWIRVQDPDGPVGMTGISLGGYTTSLVASLEDGLACAILGVPAVDLVDLIEHHAGIAPSEERRRLTELAKQVGVVVSPLALTPRVPHEGRFIYAGLGDRLVHPRRQVAQLWEHWGRPEIVWYEGGHTGFSRAKPVGKFLRTAFERSGLIEPGGGRLP